MQSKTIILATVIFSILLLSSVSALQTTQENPDEFVCDAGVEDCSRVFDNDWSTETFNPSGATGNVYMNYSKPLNAQSAIWDIKIGISASFAQQTGDCWNGTQWQEIFSDFLFGGTSGSSRNYTIPTGCFSQNPIQLHVQMDSAIGKFVHFYEEQIRWETDSSEIVSYNETLQLPQLTSNVEIDNSGLERTYLYCTWRIDNNGQEAIQMTSTLCPDPQESFTFQNDETYYRRIDRADIFWNSTATEWQVLEVFLVDESTIEYQLDLPEPPQSLFDSIVDEILGIVQNILCQIFPGLGFCSP